MNEQDVQSILAITIRMMSIGASEQEIVNAIRRNMVAKTNQKPYVYAVRIFYDLERTGYIPMAELAFGDGGRPNGKTEIIRWDNLSERDQFMINSYTFVWDEREVVTKQSFQDYINWKRD